MFKEVCLKEKFIFDHTPDFKITDFTNFYWHKKTEVLLVWVIYRCVLFVYFFVVFFVIVFFDEVIWYKNFLYYTYWSYLTQLVAFALAFAIAVERFVKEKKNPELPPLEELPKTYQALWGIYTIAAPTSVVVTVVFCLFFYIQDSLDNIFITLSSHILNSVFMIIDFIVSAIPYRFLHFYLPVLFSLIYTVFTCVYQASGGVADKDEAAIYHVLDWRHPNIALATCTVDLTCVVLAHCTLCVMNLMKSWLKKSEDTEIETADETA